MMLIDDGQRGRPHRANLLQRPFTKIGVAFSHHPNTGTVCVVVLTGMRDERVSDSAGAFVVGSGTQCSWGEGWSGQGSLGLFVGGGLGPFLGGPAGISPHPTPTPTTLLCSPQSHPAPGDFKPRPTSSWPAVPEVPALTKPPVTQSETAAATKIQRKVIPNPNSTADLHPCPWPPNLAEIRPGGFPSPDIPSRAQCRKCDGGRGIKCGRRGSGSC